MEPGVEGLGALARDEVSDATDKRRVVGGEICPAEEKGQVEDDVLWMNCGAGELLQQLHMTLRYDGRHSSSQL